jgi:hypothetical protein
VVDGRRDLAAERADVAIRTIAAALAHARTVGCDCDPDVLETGAQVAALTHEDACTRIRALRAAAGVDRLPYPVLSGHIQLPREGPS